MKIKPIVHSKAYEKTFAVYDQRNYSVVKGNDLIQRTRYSLSLTEQKLLLHLIQRIKPEDNELKDMRFSVTDYMDFMGLDKAGTVYDYIKKDLWSLAKKQFWMEQSDGSLELVRWLTRVNVNKADQSFIVRLDDNLKPYLLETKKFFTEYNYYYVMTMRKTYSIRMYELLKSYANLAAFQVDLQDLRNSMLVEDDKEEDPMKQIKKAKKPGTSTKYKEFPAFRRRVIEPSIEEINLLTDINVKYEFVRRGRKVVAVTFMIAEKSDEEKKAAQTVIEQRLGKKRGSNHE